MSLNETPTAERIHIGFFGLRNAGKSSLVNRITGQEMSVVSDIKGTTTDPVKKSMELLPLGPVTIIDTPGYDDEGRLGMLRVSRTKEVLMQCDIAVLVTEHTEMYAAEKELLALIQGRDIPYIIVFNKNDLRDAEETDDADTVSVSAVSGEGVEELKEKIASCMKGHEKQIRLAADLIEPKDTVVLVIPIDSSAPKGRLILPQQMVIRDILEAGGISVITEVEGLRDTLGSLKEAPSLVITDSQVFGKVMKMVKEDIPLTSFSILMARYKGFLDEAVRGAESIDSLKDNARVLISEGCTHHRQCEDIGTVKLPKWLSEYTGRQLELSFTSGHGYPEDLSVYDIVIHCGGCMLNDKEMQSRMKAAAAAGVPFTNYGTAIAHMNGILSRSIAPVMGRSSKRS